MVERGDILQLKRAEVAAKVIEGEAILINLVNGTYYSMDGVGGWIWQAIERGCSVDEIISAVEARYAVDGARAGSDVERFAAELLEENLVTRSNGGEPSASESPPGPDAKLPYESPTLNIFRDMEDLLALDPPMPTQKVAWSDKGE